MKQRKGTSVSIKIFVDNIFMGKITEDFMTRSSWIVATTSLTDLLYVLTSQGKKGIESSN